MGSLLRKDLEKGGAQSNVGWNKLYILLPALFSQMGTEKGAESAQGRDLRLQEVTVELAQLSVFCSSQESLDQRPALLQYDLIFTPPHLQ